MVPAVVAVVGRNNHRRQKPRPRQRLRWLRWLRWLSTPFLLKPRGRNTRTLRKPAETFFANILAVVAVVRQDNHRKRKLRPRPRLRWLRWLRWLFLPPDLRPGGDTKGLHKLL
ncbi:MAG: hypothetical protein N2557_08355 [Hydrogenophilus sp.]|nr:hypothetical protein [Hydrogenophilus sp.]